MMNDQGFWVSLASFVSPGTVVVDRARGSRHPRIPGMVYPLDYGYLEDLRSGDGDGVDVWIGSLKRQVITGVVCTVDVGKRDTEVKILLGCTRAEQRRILSLHNSGDQRAILVRPEAARKFVRRRNLARESRRAKS